MNHPPNTTLEALADRRADFIAFVAGRLGSRAEAEDLVQDAYARAISKIAELRDPERSVAWFFRVLRNAIVDHVRRRRRAPSELGDAMDLEAATASRTPDPEQLVSAAQTRALIERLGPGHRTAILHVLEGGSRSRFAREQQITETNAAVRIHRARAAARALLAVA